MKSERPLPEIFTRVLWQKAEALIARYHTIREYILKTYPGVNELLYHTHALTSVFTVSEKMSDGFCLIPIYTAHLNLGFQRGVLLNDSLHLLEGTGKLMRHIPIKNLDDFHKEAVYHLIDEAYQLAIEDAGASSALNGKTISKIKSI